MVPRRKTAVPDPADPDRLPFGLRTVLDEARPGAAWHGLRLCLEDAETAGRQVLVVRPGLPAREALLVALEAASEELLRLALAVAATTGPAPNPS